MKFGINPIDDSDIEVDITRHGMVAIVGGTGSGKTVGTLYILYQLYKWAQIENRKVEVYVGDFKRSRDFEGIGREYAEFDKVPDLIDEYYEIYEHTQENSETIRILLLDEYAGLMIWMGQTNRQRGEKLKSKISSILMAGRSRRTYVFCVMQRISSQLFPPSTGAIDNFQVNIGMGNLTVESRRSLFAGEHMENLEFEERYHPRTGEGIIWVDGERLQPIVIPKISDKEKLKTLLKKMSKECDRQ